MRNVLEKLRVVTHPLRMLAKIRKQIPEATPAAARLMPGDTIIFPLRIKLISQPLETLCSWAR